MGCRGAGGRGEGERRINVTWRGGPRFPAPARAGGAAAAAKATAEAEAEPLERAEDDAEGIAPSDLKVILLGDSAVGKSKLVERFLLDKFRPRTRSTYALTLYRHSMRVRNDKGEEETLNVDFWDTAGQGTDTSAEGGFCCCGGGC
jgi:Ras of Complex, Roc, domain of DAPkinase